MMSRKGFSEIFLLIPLYGFILLGPHIHLWNALKRLGHDLGGGQLSLVNKSLPADIQDLDLMQITNDLNDYGMILHKRTNKYDIQRICDNDVCLQQLKKSNKGASVYKDENNNIYPISSEEKYKDVVQFPEEVLDNLDNAVLVTQLLPFSPTLQQLSSHGNLQKNSRTSKFNTHLLSSVISVTIYNKDGREMDVVSSEPIILNITNSHFIPEHQERVCAYLKNGGEINSQWSTEGCHFVPSLSDSYHSICHCYHLTTFGILDMNDTAVTVPTTAEEEQKKIGVLVWVGPTIAASACIIVWLIMIGYRVLISVRAYILMSFLMALGSAEGVFVSMINYIDKPAICSCAAGYLHFSVLASFFWLLSYSIFVGQEHQNQDDNPIILTMAYYNAIGWAMPFCVVLITVIWKYDKYRDDNFCWLTHEAHVDMALMGPLILCTVLTLAVLIFDLCQYLRMKNQIKVIQRYYTKSGLRTCFAILPVMTAQWILCVLVMRYKMRWLQILYLVSGAALGFIIFLYLCYWNASVRMARKGKEKRKMQNKSENTKITIQDTITVNNKTKRGFFGEPPLATVSPSCQEADENTETEVKVLNVKRTQSQTASGSTPKYESTEF